MAELASIAVTPGGAWRARRPWLLATLVALLLGLHATLTDMVAVWWHSSTFNHCFLVLPIAVYLGLHRRDELAALAPGLSWWGVAFVAANALLWSAGHVVSIAFVQHFAAVGMVIGAVWAAIGSRPARVLLGPLLYLYFCVPEGEFLVPMLQDWTAHVLVSTLQLTGIPVFVEGRYLSIPSGNFVVAEACSGINYLIATLAVGSMFMYLNFNSVWRRALFMLVAVAVPLVANGLRAYGIVMIAHLSNYKYALGVDHFIYGWVFFGIVIFALFAIGNRFSDVRGALAPVALPAVSSPAATRGSQVATTVATVALLALLPPVALDNLAAHRALAPPVGLPTIPGWQGPTTAEIIDLGGAYAGNDARFIAGYRADGGDTVHVELTYFRTEGPGKELVNQVNHVFDKDAWQQLDYASRVPAADTGIEQVSEVRLRRTADGAEFLVWTWYDTNGRQSAGRLAIKLAQAGARLRGAHAGGAVVTVATALGDGVDGVAVLNRFLSGNAFALERLYRHP